MQAHQNQWHGYGPTDVGNSYQQQQQQQQQQYQVMIVYKYRDLLITITITPVWRGYSCDPPFPQRQTMTSMAYCSSYPSMPGCRPRMLSIALPSRR